MKPGRAGTVQASLVISVAAFAAAGAFAQTPNSSPTAILTFSSTADVNSNRGLATVSPGATFRFTEDIGFSILTETSTQSLELSGSAGFRLDRRASGTFSSALSTPNARLRYTREGANADLSLNANYRSNDVSSAYLADPLDPFSLIVDSGTLTRLDASFAASFMTNAPLSFALSASYDDRDYVGTTDPALFDENTVALGITANLRLSPTTQAALNATQTNYVSGDPAGTRYVENEYSLSVTHELASATVLGGNIGFRDRTTTASGATSQSTGVFAGLDVSRELPNGSINAGVSFDRSGSGPVSTALTFGRSLDLPSGSLSASITADFEPGSSPRFSGTAGYNQELPDGSLAVDLSQSFETDSLGQDIRFSSLGVAYNKTINSVSGVSLEMNVSRSEDAGGGTAATMDRASLSAIYARELGSDWNLSVGYTHEQTGGVSRAASDSVFLTLTKDLQFAF